MPTYAPKSTAPATFNLADAFTALITGDTIWGWLLGWVPLIGNVQYRTADFCAAGPDTVNPLDVTDFIPTRSRTGLGSLMSDLQMAFKIKAVAHDRVFGAYCEIPAGPAPLVCSMIGTFNYGPASGGGNANATAQVPIPTGTTSIRFTLNASNTGRAGFSIFAFLNGNYLGQGSDWSGNVGDSGVPSFPFPTANAIQVNFGTQTSNSGTFTMEACNGGGTQAAQPFTPAPQPQPAGVITPVGKTYATIADLGSELDRQELKLDTIHNIVAFLTGYAALPGQAIEPPVPATGQIDLTDAIGFSVAVSNIPASADEMFGTPPRYHRVGRVTIGTPNGWLPAQDITQTPMLFQPLPPGCDRCVVSVFPPATATVQILRPPK